MTDVNKVVLDSKTALPNKLLQDDNTITDITGAPVTEMDSIYEAKPALPNKFLNPDGTYSTLNEIIASIVDVDIFEVVTELPTTGKDNTIYLIPNGKGSFDEYFWNTIDNKWDKIGELDISNLATKEEVINALADAKAYTDAEVKKIVPITPFSKYPEIVTNSTTQDLFYSIRPLNLPVGTMLLGGCTLTDIESVAPGMHNEEVRIEIYPNNVFHAVMTSTNVAPYEWTIQFQSGIETWKPVVTKEMVQEMIDESVTEVLGGEY